MMEREISGEKMRCIQRIHVTGGTNGILIDALFAHRPFTPSFIGRAEDQAYILSTMPENEPKLAYLHQSGLFMRHDKEAFAQNAIKKARVGKLIGDYIRILNFSAYAKVLAGEIETIKQRVDPFTGCFISALPRTVVHLRFALAAAAMFTAGQQDHCRQFICEGAERINESLDFTFGRDAKLAKQYEFERTAWGLFYDILQALKANAQIGDKKALELVEKAKNIISGTKIKTK
jgi:hypothetical protein